MARMNKPAIDTERFSNAMRTRGIDLPSRRVLITRFSGSDQEKDLTLPPNCGGWGRIHHFRRFQGEAWPANPLPIDPAAQWLRVEPPDVMRAQVFQNAICSWRCWYCFVDFELLSANRDHADFKSVGDLLEFYLAEPDRPALIDLSGGQPDLVPEWVHWFAEEVNSRGLNTQISHLVGR